MNIEYFERSTKQIMGYTMEKKDNYYCFKAWENLCDFTLVQGTLKENEILIVSKFNATEKVSNKIVLTYEVLELENDGTHTQNVNINFKEYENNKLYSEGLLCENLNVSQELKNFKAELLSQLVENVLEYDCYSLFGDMVTVAY